MRGSLLRVHNTLKLRVVTGLFVALVSIFGAFYSAGVAQAAGETCTWDGDTDALFSTAGNWDCTPTADDNFVFSGAADFDATLDMATINSLTVAAGYSGTITISGDTIVTGDVVFAGAGGSLRLADTKVFTVEGSLTATGAGIIDGTFGASTTIQMTGLAKTVGGTGTTLFDNLTIAGTETLAGNVTSTNSIVIIATKSLDAADKSLELTGSGTPLINLGTFTPSTSNVIYDNVGATNIAAGAYYNLILGGPSTLLGHTTSTNILTLPNSGTLDAAGFNLALTAAGTPFAKAPGATFTSNLGTVIYSGVGATNIASTSYYNLIVSTTGSLLDHTTSTNVLTIADSGSSLASGYNLEFTALGTPFVNNGTFTASAGSVFYTNIGATNIATGTYFDLGISTAGTLVGSVTSTDVLTIPNGFSLAGGVYNLALTAAGTPFAKAPGATFTAGTGTVVYNAVGVTNIASTSYYNVIINGAGTLLDHTTTTAVMTLTNSGTLDAAGKDLEFTAAGTPFAKAPGATFTSNLGTVIYSGVGATNIASTSYYNLIVSTTGSLMDHTTSTNILTIVDSGSSLAAGYDLEFTALGTPFVNNGTFTASAGSVFYTNIGATNIATGTYFDLGISTAGTLVGNVTSTDVLTIPAGFSLAGGTYNLALTAAGTPFVKPSGTFTAGTGTVVYSGVGATDVATTSYYNLVIGSTNARLIGSTTSTNVITIAAGAVFSPLTEDLELTAAGTPILNLGGTLSSSGGSVYYSNVGVVNIASTTYNNLYVFGTDTLLDHTTTTNITYIEAGATLNVGVTHNFRLGSSGTPLVNLGGTLDASAGTVIYSGAGATNIASSTYLNLIVDTDGTLLDHTTTTNVLTITDTKSLNASTFNLAFTAAGTPFNKNPGATFTAGTGTVIYEGVGATNIASTSYYNLIVSTTGSLLDHTTSTNVLTIADSGSSLASGYNLEFTALGTPFVNNGTFTASAGSVFYTNAGATNIATGTYFDLGISTAGTLVGNVTSTDVLTIPNTFSLAGGVYNLALTAAGTPFNKAPGATFAAGSGTVIYDNAGATNIASTSYYNVIIATPGTLLDHTTTTNVMTIPNTFSLNAAGKNLAFTGSGTPFNKAPGATFTPASNTVVYNNAGATNIASTSYYNVIIATPGTLLDHTTTTNVMTIPNTFSLNAAGKNLAFTGSGTPFNKAPGATFTPASNTVVYNNAGATNIASTSYYNVIIATPGTLLDHSTTTNVMTIPSGFSLATAKNLAFSGSGTPLLNNGTFTASAGTVSYNNVGATNIATGTYYGLVLSTVGTLTGNATSSNAFVNVGTFTVAAGLTFNASGTYNNNGTVTETGAIQHASESSDITDNASTPVADVDTGAQIVYLTVEDQDGNLDASAVDTITGSSINASTYSDDESVTLTETGADTGIFRGSVSVALSSLGQDQNGLSELSSNGTFTLAFVDSKDAGDTGSDTATFTGSSFNGSSGSSHGGGGGGGGVKISTPNPQPVTDPSVIGGTNSQTLSFPDNASHEVKIGATVHHFTSVSATDKIATVIVESNPIKFTIRKNEVKKLDTNKDKKLDMSVTYLGFSAGVPKFIFTDLLPPKKATSTPPVVTTPAAPVVTPPFTFPVPTPVVTAPSSPSTYQFTKDLRLGSSGKDVEELQKVLKSLGYFTAVPNGNYGPATRASVMKFQKAKGLSQVGAVGPATRAALNSLSGVIAPTVVVSPVAAVVTPVATTPAQFKRNLVLGSNGADVKALQQILKNLGYFTAVPNGNYGPMTREAVIKFQKAKGLAPLGYVGPNTRNVLNSL